MTVGAALIVPFTPGTHDTIGVRVALPSYQLLAKYRYILAKSEMPAPNTIAVSVILTNDVVPFSDYWQVNESDQNFAFIGPLPANSYSIIGTVKTYDATTGSLSPACDPNTFGAQKTTPFVVYARADPHFQTSRAVVAPVIEFHNATRNHYFLAIDGPEINDLDTGVHEGWKRTGHMFLAYFSRQVGGPGLGNGASVYRYYGLPEAGIDSHFFTLDRSEYIDAPNPLAKQWILETRETFQTFQPLTATGYCPPNMAPVYRLWNNRVDSNHRYTTDLTTAQQMIAQGWVAEGHGPNSVVMCALR